jgi:hypothetical protein
MVVRASFVSVTDRQSNVLGTPLAVAGLQDATLVDTFPDQGSGFQLDPDETEWRLVLIDPVGRFVRRRREHLHGDRSLLATETEPRCVSTTLISRLVAVVRACTPIRAAS